MIIIPKVVQCARCGVLTPLGDAIAAVFKALGDRAQKAEHLLANPSQPSPEPTTPPLPTAATYATHRLILEGWSIPVTVQARRKLFGRNEARVTDLGGCAKWVEAVRITPRLADIE